MAQIVTRIIANSHSTIPEKLAYSDHLTLWTHESYLWGFPLGPPKLWYYPRIVPATCYFIMRSPYRDCRTLNFQLRPGYVYEDYVLPSSKCITP